MKLGLVTYQMAAEWDIETIISHCTEAGFAGVELRTTHAHGVEDTLSPTERDAVRKRFADSAVTAYGLGTAYEFHATDPAELQANIEGTQRAVQLATDLQMEGVKVRPNAIWDDMDEDQTLEQIGRSVRDVAAFAADHGVQIWLEVHGHETQRPDRMRRMIDIADHPNALLTYNCNPGETSTDGSCRETYDLLAPKIGCVHIQELWDVQRYPYAEVLGLLAADGYAGWTSYEGPGSSDPVLVMKCFRRMWEMMQEMKSESGRDF